jgi:adenine-specific DNA-methyltransferase
LVSTLLGEKGKFPYPKSLYAVMDTIEAAVGDRKGALILDFFAGSATTLHAAAMLNAQDGGSRRCIAVTNNEVSEEQRRALIDQGVTPGSPEFEKHGVFWAVAKPRCEAAVTGSLAIGEAVPGTYEDGSAIGDGLPENVEFLELTYLDRDQVSRGKAFDAVAPLLWLKAGAVGCRIDWVEGPFALPGGANYGVLFDVSYWRTFADALAARPDVTHAFIVTDSLAQYQQIVSELPPTVEASMLWDDYLRGFELNTGGGR